MNDDQPFLIRTDNGPIVSVPYSNEINDFTLVTRRGHTTDEVRDILIEELSVLHKEGEHTGRIMNIGLHPHVSGRAYRIRALREFLEFAISLDGVWWAHKVRNRLAHEMDYFLRYTEARQAVGYFEAALAELQLI